MDAIMLLTFAMIGGGPLMWWILRRTAAPRSPAAANAGALVMIVSLLVYVAADAILLISGVYSTGHTVGVVLWVIAGALAV